MQAAAALGVSGPFNKLPHEMEKDFFSRYPNQDIDQIFAKLLKDAPDIKRAETKLLQAERNLDQAKLNLRYCKVYAEIDGAVTRKSVNPGNNVVAGQSIMAIRSVKEIWIDANFKETQLANLRIGQRVRCEVDMYGSRKEFEGRITGFTMGTGQTLALLAAAECHGQLRQNRPAAAGPHRPDRLRPGQGAVVRRALGGAARVLQGAAHGAACGQSPATVGRQFRQKP